MESIEISALPIKLIDVLKFITLKLYSRFFRMNLQNNSG